DPGCARSCPAPGVLSTGLSAPDHRRTAFVSERNEKGGIDGVRSPHPAGRGLDPFSHYALECFRAADAVPALRRAPFTPGCGRHLVRPRHDRSEFLTNPAAVPTSGVHFAYRRCASVSWDS